MKHTPAIAPTKPTLNDLAYILRHKELWPPNFEWYWGNCNTCAMGLLFRFHGIEGEPNSLSAAKALGINMNDAYNLFVTSRWFAPTGIGPITPEMVARGIDNFLASKEARPHG